MERQTLHSDKYLDVYYTVSTKLLEEYWKEETEDMTDATYQVITSDLMGRLENEGIVTKRLLLDNRKFLFTMPPKLQDWQKEAVFSRLSGLGAEKDCCDHE